MWGIGHFITFICWFLSNFLGNPMLIGLVDYERNGNDPLKRNLIDMVRLSTTLHSILIVFL